MTDENRALWTVRSILEETIGDSFLVDSLVVSLLQEAKLNCLPTSPTEMFLFVRRYMYKSLAAHVGANGAERAVERILSALLKLDPKGIDADEQKRKHTFQDVFRGVFAAPNDTNKSTSSANGTTKQVSSPKPVQTKDAKVAPHAIVFGGDRIVRSQLAKQLIREQIEVTCVDQISELTSQELPISQTLVVMATGTLTLQAWREIFRKVGDVQVLLWLNNDVEVVHSLAKSSGFSRIHRTTPNATTQAIAATTLKLLRVEHNKPGKPCN